jgi:hypothetical protein
MKEATAVFGQLSWIVEAPSTAPWTTALTQNEVSVRLSPDPPAAI